MLYSQMVRAVDCFLFSILVLGYFTDRRGNLWRRKYSHMYMIELTLPTSEDNISFSSKNLFKLLPSRVCQAPVTVRERHLDYKNWSTDPYQRVYYYLKYYDPSQETPDFLPKKFKELNLGITRNRDFLRCIFR